MISTSQLHTYMYTMTAARLGFLHQSFTPWNKKSQLHIEKILCSQNLFLLIYPCSFLPTCVGKMLPEYFCTFSISSSCLLHIYMYIGNSFIQECFLHMFLRNMLPTCTRAGSMFLALLSVGRFYNTKFLPPLAIRSIYENVLVKACVHMFI